MRLAWGKHTGFGFNFAASLVAGIGLRIALIEVGANAFLVRLSSDIIVLSNKVEDCAYVVGLVSKDTTRSRGNDAF